MLWPILLKWNIPIMGRIEGVWCYKCIKSVLYVFSVDYTSKEALGPQNNVTGNTQFPSTTFPSVFQSHYYHLAIVWYITNTDEPMWHIVTDMHHLLQSSLCCIQLWVLTKPLLSCTHHYSVKENNFTALNITWTPLIHSYVIPHGPRSHRIFLVSSALSFL